MKQKSPLKFTPEFKAKVALEAIKGQGTLTELSLKFEVSSAMISRWKGEFVANAAKAFISTSAADKSTEDLEKLYAQIGKLKVEVDFLKNASTKLRI